MRRGVIKAFRDYLNKAYPVISIDGSDSRHRNNQFHQDTRPYGDYLYFQDRSMFNNLLSEAMRGAEVRPGEPRYPGWDHYYWASHRQRRWQT